MKTRKNRVIKNNNLGKVMNSTTMYVHVHIRHFLVYGVIASIRREIEIPKSNKRRLKAKKEGASPKKPNKSSGFFSCCPKCICGGRNDVDANICFQFPMSAESLFFLFGTFIFPGIITR